MSKKLKIGLIQNDPITADLSRNLRQIVQGYRECLEHGADIVVASAHALCGAGVKDLAKRISFLQQTEDAIETLAAELSNTPLIVGAYALPQTFTQIFGEDSDCEDEPAYVFNEATEGRIVPYLLENGDVTELTAAETIDINGVNVYIDMHELEVLIDDEDVDLIVHMPTTSWHTKLAQENEENRLWEATQNNAPVVCVRPVATADGVIYGGGSGVYLPGNVTHTRLPFFEPAAKVARISSTSTARALPTDEELLTLALEHGIRDTMRLNGYVGVCLSLDEPHSLLLAALCAEAVGASNVHGISFTQEKNRAESLHIVTKHFKETESSQETQAEFADTMEEVLRSRQRNTLLITYADRHGLLPLSAITRHDIMLNNFVLYGNAGGYLAPLGNMYEMDAYMLSTYFNEKHDGLFGTLKQPEHPEQDRIIHELADRNISAGALLNDHVCPFSESDVRSVQRRIIASAQKRTQLPMVLRIDAEYQRLDIPTIHRLND